jgi:hypothetical protein
VKTTIIAVTILLLLSSTGVNAGEWVTDGKTNCKIWTGYSKPKDVSWSGPCEDGYASGSGTLVVWYQDGKEQVRYEGEMKGGKRSGKGTDTIVVGFVPQMNGTKYIGTFIDDNMTGKGVTIFPEGDKYEGDFLKGKWHGKGTFTLTNGNKYEGDWVKGRKTGKGTFTYSDGSKYEGDFLNGKRHGKGALTMKNGDKYQGDFVVGQRTGKGTYTWAKGGRYEGDFVDGKVHGKGTYICRDGKQFSGDFENDKPVGFTIQCN